MNSELLAVLNYMEKERGIDRETLIQAVEYALQGKMVLVFGCSSIFLQPTPSRKNDFSQVLISKRTPSQKSVVRPLQGRQI